MRLAFALAIGISLCVASIGVADDRSDATARPFDVSKLRSLSPSELAALRGRLETRTRDFENLAGSFTIKIQKRDKQTAELAPFLTCTAAWRRLGSIQRLELTYPEFIPAALSQAADRTIYDDGQKQTAWFRNTSQALITPSGPLVAVPTPADLLFPAGFRQGVDKLIEQSESTSAYALDEEQSLLRLRMPPPADVPLEIYVVLSGDGDILEWRCPSRNNHCRISWATSGDGTRIPIGAWLTAFDVDNVTPITKVDMEIVQFVFGAVKGKLGFQLPPRTLVTEYGHDIEAGADVYRIGENGEKTRVKMVEQARAVGPVSRAVVWLAVGAAVCGVLLFRLGFWTSGRA